MLLHLQFPLPLHTNRPPLFPRPLDPRHILPHLLSDPHAVKKRLSYLWPLQGGVGATGLFNGCGGGKWFLADRGGAGLVGDLPIGVRGFENAEESGVGFLLCGFGALGALSGLDCFFG